MILFYLFFIFDTNIFFFNTTKIPGCAADSRMYPAHMRPFASLQMQWFWILKVRVGENCIAISYIGERLNLQRVGQLGDVYIPIYVLPRCICVLYIYSTVSIVAMSNVMERVDLPRPYERALENPARIIPRYTSLVCNIPVDIEVYEYTKYNTIEPQSRAETIRCSSPRLKLTVSNPSSLS